MSATFRDSTHVYLCKELQDKPVFLKVLLSVWARYPLKASSTLLLLTIVSLPPVSHLYAEFALFFWNISRSVLRICISDWDWGAMALSTATFFRRRCQTPISKVDWLYGHGEICCFSIAMSEWKVKGSTSLQTGGCSCLWTQHILGSTSLPTWAGKKVYPNIPWL